jgi:hypothetical protein
MSPWQLSEHTMDNIDLEQLQGIVNDIVALEAENASEGSIDERCAELADFVQPRVFRRADDDTFKLDQSAVDKLSGTNFASSVEDDIVILIIDTGDDNTIEIQVPNFHIGDDSV